MTSCDSINNGQRGFSVETSKLEAVYFQPGFWGNLCQCLSAWPGVYLPPILGSKPVTGKGTPAVFLQPLPSSREDGSCAEGSLPWREGVSCQKGWTGRLQSALGSWGADSCENLVSSQEGQARWAQQDWAGMGTSGPSCQSFTITIVTF